MSMTVEDKARIYRELAKLLGASFPLDKSIAMLAEQHTAGWRGDFLRSIATGLEARLPLAEAVKQHGAHLTTDLERSLLSAGERSGRLAEACTHLAQYFELMHQGIREARGALIYPLLLLHVGIIVPEFSRSALLSGLSGEAAAPVQAILIRLGIFWLLMAVLWFGWRKLSHMAATSETADRWLNRLPLIGSVRRHWALARFCEVFHSTLLASMRITECLGIAGDASQSGLVRTGSLKAAASVEKDATLAEALNGSRAFPRSFTNSIATAEASGGLDKEFQRWAEAETQMAGEAQRRAADLYPKALYFLVLGYIALRIVGFASDYFGAFLNVEKMMR